MADVRHQLKQACLRTCKYVALRVRADWRGLPGHPQDYMEPCMDAPQRVPGNYGPPE